MKTPKVEIQALCGSFNRPTSDIESILSKMKSLPDKVGPIYDNFLKRDVKQVAIVDLKLPDTCYKTNMLHIISRICYLYDIKAYCRLVMTEYIEPEKVLYLVGPTMSCTLVSTVIKYLYKCRLKINSSNIGINTILETKTFYFEPLLDVLNNQKKVKIKYSPLYQRVLKSEMMDRLMFNLTPTQLSTKKHWLKSVKLRKPKFKDKYLI